MPNPLYLIAAADLTAAGLASSWWPANRLTPLVLIPGHGTLLYDPKTTQAQIEAAVKDIRTRIAGPYYLAFWALNVYRRGVLMDWADAAAWSLFLERMAWLGQSGKRFGALGVLPDLENYHATKNDSGGKMKAGAWPDHPRLEERAQAYAKALSGLTLGGYVWTPEVKRHAGLKRWLLETHRASGRPGLLLGEDYVGSRDGGAGRLVQARYLRGYQGRRPPLLREGWVWDPKRVLLG